MKKFLKVLSIVVLLCSLASSSFALSDKDYKLLMKDRFFAAVDKRMNQTYNRAKKILSKKSFERIRRQQREWVANERDAEAEALMEDENLSFVEAYTRATESQIEVLESWIDRELER